MLLDTIAGWSQILSVVCLATTLVCILIKKNNTYIPTMISLFGSVFYMVFLGCAAHHMDTSLEKSYVALTVIYLIFAFVAHYDFRHPNKKESAQ